MVGGLWGLGGRLSRRSFRKMLSIAGLTRVTSPPSSAIKPKTIDVLPKGRYNLPVMTKYVLNSGGLRRHPQPRKRFHQELVKGLGGRPRFLVSAFTRSREHWESKFQEFHGFIQKDVPEGVAPVFELAMPSQFTEQCGRADVIYFLGGDVDLLHYWTDRFDLPVLFRGKVVGTNSASSWLLSASFWSCDWRECKDGLGILPIKFIAHYQSDFGADDPRGPIDWQKAYADLAAYGDTSLPIHALKEGEFIVIEQ
jgi:hypothetical protein